MTVTYANLARSKKPGFRSQSANAVILFLLAMGVLALFLINPFDKSLETRMMSVLVMAVGMAPFINWLRQPAQEIIPLLPIYSAFTALTFGLAGFLTPPRFISDIQVLESSAITALQITLTSLVVTYAAYGATRYLLQSRRRTILQAWENSKEVDLNMLRFGFPAAVVLKTGVSVGILQGAMVPVEAFSTLVFGWLLYGLFSKRYSGFTATVVAFGALPYFVVTAALSVLGASLIAFASVGLAFALCFTAARGRFPLATAILVVMVALLLQTLKHEVRQQTWRTDASVGLIEQGEAWSRAISASLQRSDDFFQRLHEGYTRYNQLQLTAAVLERVPEPFDYFYGETYLPLLTKWIPRFMWKDKPVEDIGNRWAQALQMLHASDNVTSLNLPWITEMWLNWGWIGVLFVSAAFGALFALLWHFYIGQAALSVGRFASAFAVLFPFLMPQESNFSIAGGNVFVAAIVTYLAISALRFISRSG